MEKIYQANRKASINLLISEKSKNLKQRALLKIKRLLDMIKESPGTIRNWRQIPQS